MKKIILLTVLIFISTVIFSQSISSDLISSGGDNFVTNDFKLEWSIGEPVIETFANSNVVLTQGFHQNNYYVTLIFEIPLNDYDFFVYPNPSSDLIHLKIKNITIEDFSTSKFTIQLSDISGKIIFTSDVISDNQEINLLNYSVGTYFLSIIKDNVAIKSFNIIKY